MCTRERFFFSSRRRHTRSYGDWSSDVCSSDLLRYTGGQLEEILGKAHSLGKQVLIHAIGDAAVSQAIDAIVSVTRGKNEIGRASCREREAVGADAVPRLAWDGLRQASLPQCAF